MNWKRDWITHVGLIKESCRGWVEGEHEGTTYHSSQILSQSTSSHRQKEMALHSFLTRSNALSLSHSKNAVRTVFYQSKILTATAPHPLQQFGNMVTITRKLHKASRQQKHKTLALRIIQNQGIFPFICIPMSEENFGWIQTPKWNVKHAKQLIFLMNSC